MANKRVISRMQQKSDTSANWALATTFVPLKGEVIVYSDLNKIKIGDGTTTVGNLAFVKSPSIEVRENVTMLAANWSSSTYSFETSYPNATYNISIEVAPTATAAQAKAFGKALITGSASTNIVTALGTVPTVDIPIIITSQIK